VIVGAGAAGLMAAIHCAKTLASRGDRKDVVVVESTRDGGKKILISGGGRCNILPGELDETRFVTESSVNTMNKIVRSWPLHEQRRFFEEELGIPLRLEADSGKLFPASNRARDVRDALVGEARRLGVAFRFESAVVAVEPIDTASATGARWRVVIAGGDSIDASAVVLATGGLSVPNTGSDGAGLGIARSLGHRIQPTYAALTPLTDSRGRFASLAGVSLDVALEAPARRQKLRVVGGFLFTHRGFSGPAVLDVSHLAVRSISAPSAVPAESSASTESARKPQPIFAQWTPLDGDAWERELAPRRASVAGVMRAYLPARLADRLLELAEVPIDRSLAELRRDERLRLIDALTHFELPWTGHEGYRTAEVTGGGVALAEIDPRTMESRRCPGLFLCGEMLDAFGPIGGYNFLWAWATGRAAGAGAAISVDSGNGS